MLVPWRVSLHGVWEHLWIDVRFQHRVPPQRSRSCRRCILAAGSLPMAVKPKRVKALSVLLWLELVNMFLSRIQTPCRPLVSSVYYFWCTKMPMILGLWFLDGSCSGKCVFFFFCILALMVSSSFLSTPLRTKHFLGWSIQLHADIRYQMAPENPWGFSSGSVEIHIWKPRDLGFS